MIRRVQTGDNIYLDKKKYTKTKVDAASSKASKEPNTTSLNPCFLFVPVKLRKLLVVVVESECGAESDEAGANRRDPTNAVVKPENRTRTIGFLGNDKRGFIDFYINYQVQWAVELLRLGDSIKVHIDRFHPVNGSYRELSTKDYIVVDLRRPKEQELVDANGDLCVLYRTSRTILTNA
jgi:hypothetical protein